MNVAADTRVAAVAARRATSELVNCMMGSELKVEVIGCLERELGCSAAEGGIAWQVEYL